MSEEKYRGLKLILAKIIQDPSNKLLRDRYLSLVEGVDNPDRKCELLLSFAKEISDHAPRSALEQAYVAYRLPGVEDRLPALKTLREIFEAMRDQQKASMIEQEIQNLLRSRAESVAPKSDEVEAVKTTPAKRARSLAVPKAESQDSVTSSPTDSDLDKTVHIDQKLGPGKVASPKAAEFSGRNNHVTAHRSLDSSPPPTPPEPSHLPMNPRRELHQLRTWLRYNLSVNPKFLEGMDDLTKTLDAYRRCCQRLNLIPLVDSTTAIGEWHQLIVEKRAWPDYF